MVCQSLHPFRFTLLELLPVGGLQFWVVANEIVASDLIVPSSIRGTPIERFRVRLPVIPITERAESIGVIASS